jgi:hypothetical protein
MTQEEIQKATEDYQVVMNKILNHFAGDAFKEEVRFAKGEFFDNSGILDEHSENFELRMSQFFDWYLFTRELRGYSQTPLESVFSERELRFSPEEIVLIDKLKEHRHSIFEFLKIKDGDVYLKDLLKNDKLIVRKSPWTTGFDSDELFEIRLIPFKDTWIFTRGFCFHPIDAKKFILSEIKRHRKNPDLDPNEMMLRLIRMRYKFERYRHVKIDMIYSTDSKVGL